MAVGKNPFPEMAEISGVRLGTACAGIKQQQRDDLLIMELAASSSCAAVFTRNAFCAAPVIVARENLDKSPRWILVNSGNANAGTGQQGLLNAHATCTAIAKLTCGLPGQVLPFSTGVIGEPLPVEKITAALPAAVAALSLQNWAQAAKAIMTTDTFPKGATRSFAIAGKPVSVTGISKGAGMIQPNMATMLAFVATDAEVSQPLLQHCLQQAVEQSFNRITVDGDTSTNDACVLVASGASGTPEITRDAESYPEFVNALQAVCNELAEKIVRDGEGATKLMRILVEQARDRDEALRVAKTIAHSPLVKTAFFAGDPNWGRILAAVGRAGVENMQLNDIKIYLDDVCIVSNGGRSDTYTEQAGQRVMKREEITVRVALARGATTEQVLTCDLSYDYVRINAEYRT